VTKKFSLRKYWNLVDRDDPPTSGQIANKLPTNGEEFQNNATERAGYVLIIDDALSIW
jgi:hypothetical protein